MLNYVDKPGVNEAIAAAGHWVELRDGVLVSSDDAAVQQILDGYSLAQAQAYKSAQVSALAKAKRDKAIGSISAGEMASWPIKLAEAAKYAATGDASGAPMLSAEAAARGVTLAVLVAKVGGNATNFAALEAQIGGTDGRHRDAIKALPTFEALAGYDYSTGWPQV